MGVSLYDILGVAPKATPAEIQAAYEDKTAEGRPLDAARRMALKEAFGVLSNAQRRAAYDQSLRSRSYERARVVAAEEAGPGWGRKALIAGVLVVLVGGAWFALKRPAVAPASKPIVVRPAPLQTQGAEPVSAQAAAARDTGAPLTPEQLYAAVAPSIMRINVSRRDGAPVAVGSGVAIDGDTVITNCHVALAGDVVQVRDAQSLLPASVIVADEEFDLCKLRVNGLTTRPVAIGASTQLNVGQKVFAIGSPQGLDLTLSDGLVSSLRETPFGTVIQTTAPVSPGSSGGGLFDQRGRLVGIITFQMRSGQNLNFAIPVEWIDKMTNRRSDAVRDQGARPTSDGQRD